MSKLSIGGMGTVYRAEHKLIGKLAAVKVLHPELSTNEELINRFFNEAKATTQIKHPGIVEVFDFGYMESGHAYLVMEFLEGMSLARRLKLKGKMNEGEAAMILRSVCNALAAAHAKGIIHRDLKPDNIFLVPDPESPSGERPKVLDFGIAKLTEPGLAGEATKTGAVMGTPTYMSPEQCRGTGDVDHRADIYSLGCIFYELVSGRPPFQSLGAGELLGAHLYLEPEPLSKHCKKISDAGERLAMTLLRKKPEKRVQTVKELAQRFSMLAQDLGWITATSPSGVTAQALAELPKIETPEAYMATTATPAGDDSSPLLSAGFLASLTGDDDEPQKPDKPTTLSGAASVSELDAVPRSRKGLVIGMGLVAAVLAGMGAFAFVKISNDDSAPRRAASQPAAASQAATPAPAPTPAPKPEPPPPPPAAPTPPPEEAAAPAPPPAETAPVAVDNSAAKPADKPKTVKRAVKLPAKQPAKPPDKKPEQQQPAKNPLIETDL